MSQWNGYLYYDKAIRGGAKLQFFILDPDSSDVTLIPQKTTGAIEDVKADILRSVAFLENMTKTPIETGSIEVRFMMASPKYSMVLIDPYGSNGKIIIEFIGYGTAQIQQRPHFELTQAEGGIWYEYFLQQFQNLEKSSRIAMSTNRT